MKSFAQCRLYTFVDTAYLGNRSASEVTTQLCEGGADLVQIRAKGASEEELVRLMDAVLPVTKSHDVCCVLNDFPVLAQTHGVPCVHLGQEDFFELGGYTMADQLWNSRKGASGFRPALGLSTHGPDQALRAVAAGADYVAIGPIFPTPTKPGRVPVTTDYVQWAAENLTVPWFAIGGIHLGNLQQILDAGAQRVCVVSAILQSDDIARTTAEFRRRLSS